MPMAEARLAEEDRARRVAPDRERGEGEERRGQQRAGRSAPTTSIARLTRRDEPARDARAGGREREALDRVDADLRADHLEEPRHDVDLDVVVAERADELQRLASGLVRERDDDAIDRVHVRTSSRSASGAPRSGEVARGPGGAPWVVRRRTRRG